MDNVFYVLKFGDEYVRFHKIGGGSVQLTHNIGQANQFNSKNSAEETHQTIFTNSADYMFENEKMNASTVHVAKVVFEVIREEKII
jgi:hypothetical protein